MSYATQGQATAEQRRQQSLIFQFVGVTDILLGAAVALFGPGLVGGEPLVDAVLLAVGLMLAAGGVGFIWFARRRGGADGDRGRTGSAFKVDG